MISPFHLKILVLLMLILQPAWSDDNYWQCAVHDNENKQWEAKSAYERVATSKAFEACKKESHVPVSCKLIKDSCDYSGKDNSSASLWQCTALDQTGQPWEGKPNSNKDNAALDAKAYCQAHSPAPDTCFINLLTCKVPSNE